MRSDSAIKKQLALSVAKGKRVELQLVLDKASGGGSWRRVIITRIAELDKEIKEIEGFNNEPKGKINEAV